jgi:hypothetical protein|tara:strand:- start:1080 stop:1199 length:120 start_codon:yes stop_codon:yes gene_type:complete
MEFKIKKYTIPQKVMLGLITFVFAGIPILFWILIAIYFL